MDPILLKYADLIDSHAYITYQLSVINSAQISQIELSDIGKVNKFKSHMYGVGPYIYDALIDDFLIKGSYNESTGLIFGEQLYTARGA